MFEFLRHEVESLGKFANFGAALQLHTLRKISTRDGVARLSQHLKWIGDASGWNDSDADTQRDAEQREDPRRPLHFVNAAVSIVAGFLYDDSPIQVSYRTVCSQHDNAFSSAPGAELTGGGDHLGFAALLHKIADN